MSHKCIYTVSVNVDNFADVISVMVVTQSGVDNIYYVMFSSYDVAIKGYGGMCPCVVLYVYITSHTQFNFSKRCL